ncbi:MAG: hypothetical protein WC627_10555 [Legionella sp.]
MYSNNEKPIKSKRKEKAPFSKNDIVFSQGDETCNFSGKKVNQITIAPHKRDAFFRKHPNLLNLLKREGANPLIQEPQKNNDVNGEFFITPEATALLIERMFRQEKNRILPAGEQFNTKNIFIIDNNTELLEKILTELIIKDNEDAKFIYVDKVHASLLYMRQIKNTMYCYILDSEFSVAYHFSDALKKIYPNALLTESDFTLLKDYYSCFTFALKSLRYFVKHGHEFFPLIIKGLNDENHRDKMMKIENPDSNNYLELKELPPALLKLYQGSVQFSEEILNTIVSVKKKQTLKDYYQEYAFAVNDKQNYNSAALLKKYHYFEILANYLAKCLLQNDKKAPENNKIDPEKIEDLPLSLHKRILKFSDTPRMQLKNATIPPVDKYLGIQEILDSHKDVLSPYEKSLIQPIEEKFPNFKNSYYQLKNTHKKNSDASNKIITLLLIAAFVEIQDIGHIKLYLEFAQKLIVLFGNYTYVLDYFRKHASCDTQKPLHALCLFEMPKESLSNKEYWIKLVLNFGPNATKYLADSAQINQLLKNDNFSLKKLGLTSELDRVALIAAHVRYQRGKEHPQLALLALQFNVPEEVFEKCLDLTQNQAKSFDYLPDITIHGATLNSRFNQYIFSKLPAGDLDGLFLGEYTSCCQSFGKSAESAIVNGMTSLYSGFYVVRRNDKIIAQSWVWITEDGEVVFDSWEFINKHEGHIYKPFILKAAEQLIDYGFSRVLIGVGGKTPKMGLEVTEDKAQRPPHNTGYSDASHQFIIKDNSERSPFTEFAKKHSSYASWVSEDLDNDAILEKISELIVANQLSFANFINLIRFFHIYQHKILFHTSQAHKTLFQNAIAAYRHLMTPLYKIIIEEDVTVLDLLISYSDNSLLNNLICQINESELSINTLMHRAVAHNAIQILTYLYSIHPQAENTDAIAAISNNTYPSLLFTAVQNNAQACAFFILSKITREQLIILIQQKNQQNKSILHYLAINNAVAIFNKIVQQCATPNAARLIVPENDSPIDFIKTALYTNSLDFCRVYKKSLPDIPIPVPPDLIMSAIDAYPHKQNLETFTWLKEQFENKNDWFEYLQTKDKDNQSVMYRVLHRGYFYLALHLLKDFDDLEINTKIHDLLLGINEKSWFPIEALKHCPLDQPQAMHAFFTKMLQVYDRQPDQLIELFCKGNYAAFQAIIASQNIELFHTVLKKLCYKTNSHSLFYNTKQKTDTILNAMIEVFNQSNISTRIIPLNVLIQFINALFSYCSEADKEELLLQLNYELITGDVLEYLLENNGTKNNRAFLANWARLDNDSILSAILKQTKNRDVKFYQVLFKFYVAQHSKNTIQEFLLNQWDNLISVGTIYKNPFLLRVLYTLFEEKQDILGQLLTANLQKDLSTPHDLYRNFNLYLTKWIKTPTKASQNNMSALLWGLLIQIMILYNKGGNRLFSHLIMDLLIPMIKVIQTNNSDAFCVFKLEHSTDLAILTYYLQQDQLDVERVSHAIKLILINCTHEQRLELIATYHKKLSGRFKEAIMQELESYVAALEKLDILLELKSDLTVLNETKKTARFFPKISREHKELANLLKPFDANKVAYVTSEEKWLYITTEEINTAWEKILTILNTKIPKNNLSSPAPAEFLGMVLKYQQKMSALEEPDALERTNHPASMSF